MSPNEFQLRSALRDGEGEPVNPDTVIARARGLQQARHDRRVRYGSVAAVVAIVGGIGVVGGVVLGGSGETSSASKGGGPSLDRGANRGAGGAVVSKPHAASVSEPTSAAAVIPCPDSAPELMLPGGGGTGQFGADGPLFSGPVLAVKVCAYANSTSRVVPSTVVTGENATALAKSMEDSARTPKSIMCPARPATTDPGSLVIIGVDAKGSPMKPVEVTLNCPSRVTNGTALRYNWQPPANITKLINQRVNPSGGAISLPPSGKVTGSPVRS
jgi:hypothetical protein